MKQLSGQGSSQAVAKRMRIGRAIVVGVRFRARDNDAIVEPGVGQKPRDRQSADHAARRQGLDQFVTPAVGVRMVNSLKKCALTTSTEGIAESWSASATALA